MKLSKLIESLSLSVITGDPADTEFDGVYVGDLLSRAMSHVKENDLWITIMSNTNVIAVASLTGCSAVLLAEDVVLLPDALDAAKENGILVLSSEKTVFDLCAGICSPAVSL